MFTEGYKGLQMFRKGYKWLRGVTKGNKWLKKLQGVTTGLQRVTKG